MVVDREGKIVRAWGDPDRVVYPRSAVKPLQALALVETGAADAFDVTEAELALASGSHGGTPEHTGVAGRWLERLGLGLQDLTCGNQQPLDEDAARDLAKAGQTPGPLHNNCSGKHLGFLTAARHLGEPVAGYAEPGHPAQERVARILSDMGGAALAQAPRGTDGCGIPVLGMPLTAMARALASMADPGGLGKERAVACRRITAAVAAHPVLVAGPGRFDTVALAAAKGQFSVKTGAEGMYGAILPGPGLGVALKIDDGAKRAAEVAMAAILKRLGALDAAAETALAGFLETPVFNAKNERIGSIHMADSWAD